MFIFLGSDMCISSMQRCNAYKDCPHGEDEQNCAVLGDKLIFEISKIFIDF